MFNDLTSPARLLATRRSGKPRDMVEPGPNEDQLSQILESAIRVPDHGKLAPWRLVIIGTERRRAFASLLERAYRVDAAEPGRLALEAVEQFAFQAPTLVTVISVVNSTSQVPVWEQELSAGALCINLLLAAHAQGFVGSWLTGWASYSVQVAEGLGFPGAKIAGFLFLGSPGRALEERPRPDFGSVVSHWRG